MSYAQFLSELRNRPAKGGRCVQEEVIRHNIGCRFNGEFDEVIPGEVDFPEHRENEEWPIDPVFGKNADGPYGIPYYNDLSGREIIDHQDLYKLNGRVIGRHDAVVDKAWYLNQDYIVKCLKCTHEQASDLIGALEGIGADESTVQLVVNEVRVDGIHQVTIRYQLLAILMKQLDASENDAMEHRNEEGFSHNEIDRVSHNMTPEWELLVDEGISLSAAQIAHDVGCSLADAGDIREALVLQMHEYALDLAQDYGSLDSDEADELCESDDDEKDGDSVGFVSEGWHLMDDKDDYGPSWLDKQPEDVRMFFFAAEGASNLAELKKIGQDVYASTLLNHKQSKGFWAVWHARRNAILLQTQERIAKVRKGVQRIVNVDPKDFARLGKRLFDLSKAQPNFYSPEGWAVIWGCHKSQKAEHAVKPQINRTQLVAQFLAANAR